MNNESSINPHASQYVLDAVDDRFDVVTSGLKQYRKELEAFKDLWVQQSGKFKVTTRERHLLDALVEILVPLLTNYHHNVNEKQWEADEDIIRRKLMHEIQRFTEVTD